MLIYCCNLKDHSISQFSSIYFTVENAYNHWLYLEELPFGKKEKKILDSVFLKDRVESHKFIISDSEQHVYQFRTDDSRMIFLFINDKKDQEGRVDYSANTSPMTFGSPATASLNHFIGNMVARTLPSIAQIQKIVRKDQLSFRNYVDTVSSPAAALYIFSKIEFDKDLMSQEALVNRLWKRFPNHSLVKKLHEETSIFISILQYELQTGDLAPEIALPDTSGKIISLQNFRGKYVLLDFWASWCAPCRMESSYKIASFKKKGIENFIILSVGLDQDKTEWLQGIYTEHYTWPQLIDSAGWSGNAAKTYKFDSIPFNFLIDPTGHIIGKALYGDSLIINLDRLIK